MDRRPRTCQAARHGSALTAAPGAVRAASPATPTVRRGRNIGGMEACAQRSNTGAGCHRSDDHGASVALSGKHCRAGLGSPHPPPECTHPRLLLRFGDCGAAPEHVTHMTSGACAEPSMAPNCRGDASAWAWAWAWADTIAKCPAALCACRHTGCCRRAPKCRRQVHRRGSRRRHRH